MLINLFLGNFAQLESESQVFVDGHMRIESIVLKDHRYVPIFRQDVVDQFIADVDFALGDFFQASYHTQHCGFATTGGSYQDDELPILDF